jgi:N-acetylneuraminic acid mutarotase
MHEVRPRVLERVVDWLYSGELGEISDVGEGLALLEGSRFLRVERLEAQCIAWLCAHVEAANCVSVWGEASRLGCGALAERALAVAGRWLARVAGEAEFLGLPREVVLELVRSDGLAVWSERAVYEAVMGWVRHDVGSRKAWLGEMLGAVRMALMPPAYLVGTVGRDPLVRESLEALRMFADASRYSQSRGAERAAAERDGLFRRRKHASGGELVVVGGYDHDSSNHLKSAEWYDASAGQWRDAPDMSGVRSGCAAVCIEGQLYVVGGYDGHDNLKSAEVYDASAGQWRSLPKMSVARNACAAVCVEEKLYVVGGEEGDDALKSAEVYDASAGQWHTLRDMSVSRARCAAVCIEGKLCVVGGHDGESALKSAEVYDPSTRQWRALPDMSTERKWCAAVCIEGNVYVVGGDDDDGSVLRSAEVYDASVGQWRALPEMSVARSACAVVGIEGKLYVVGGSDGTVPLASVECYDPVANEWRMLPSMSTARAFCAAAVGEMGAG